MNPPLTNPASKQIPSALGYAMPAEWAAHEATWLSWPHNQETWPGKRLEKVREIYFQMLEALLPHEKVRLLVSDERQQEEIQSKLPRRGINSKNLICHQQPTVDAWIRDYGPTFLIKSDEQRALQKKAWCKWIFNAWGGKYPSLMKDTKIFKNRELIPYPCFELGVILEGGSIEVNGEGTCLTTEQCLLNRNRNPRLSRQEIEQLLKDYLGVSHIVWLHEGIAGDDTDGHIDDIARFVNTTTILAAYEKEEADENYPVLKKNWGLLENSKDPQGRKWDLVKFPMPGKVVDDGARLPASYANFYIANEVVLLPVYEHRNDKNAASILKELFPKHHIAPISCKPLVYGLGAIHCVTQQEPGKFKKPQ